jgi:hypothetical protein
MLSAILPFRGRGTARSVVEGVPHEERPAVGVGGGGGAGGGARPPAPARGGGPPHEERPAVGVPPPSVLRTATSPGRGGL